mmetsp:Transcript_7032/g.17203  ORF Transcript_7032/g.17203 Transcript_7032/m.17203 type:complete len:118 (-) Transcript_7032:38-391(-)
MHIRHHRIDRGSDDATIELRNTQQEGENQTIDGGVPRSYRMETEKAEEVFRRDYLKNSSSGSELRCYKRLFRETRGERTDSVFRSLSDVSAVFRFLFIGYRTERNFSATQGMDRSAR